MKSVFDEGGAFKGEHPQRFSALSSLSSELYSSTEQGRLFPNIARTSGTDGALRSEHRLTRQQCMPAGVDLGGSRARGGSKRLRHTSRSVQGQTRPRLSMITQTLVEHTEQFKSSRSILTRLASGEPSCWSALPRCSSIAPSPD